MNPNRCFKLINSAILMMAATTVFGEDFTLVTEGQDGLPITSCGTHAVVSPINYSDNNCQINMEMVVNGDTVKHPTG